MDCFPTIKDLSFSPKVNYTPHSVLVLGNGFDLSLGMKTKYSDFASNEKYWPFKESMFANDDHSLPHFVILSLSKRMRPRLMSCFHNIKRLYN